MKIILTIYVTLYLVCIFLAHYGAKTNKDGHGFSSFCGLLGLAAGWPAVCLAIAYAWGWITP